MKDVVVLLLIMIFVFGAIFGVGTTIDYFGTRATCNSKTVDMGFDSRFSFWGGCQIEVQPGRWIPLESYYFKEE